jgi:hypothetical protein
MGVMLPMKRGSAMTHGEVARLALHAARVEPSAAC